MSDTNGIPRRHFVAGVAVAAALRGSATASPAFAAARGSSDPPVDVVRAFGFVPDDRTDNYDAFIRWSRHVNDAGGGHYVFPPGTYFVRRFRTPHSPEVHPGPRVPSIYGANGLTISGAGAKIRLNGAFRRAPRSPAGHDQATFMPFDLRLCRNVRIQGLEMDGGVRDMTRDPSMDEAYAHLIALCGCVDVTLEDLHLHHSQTDAVILYHVDNGSGRPGTACRNITMNRVICRNNGRGGLAPLQVRGLVATDCSFDGTGQDLGRYGVHAPGFGVCVEPDFFLPGDIDIKTGDLEFRRCRFDGNYSAFLAAYGRRYEGYLRLIDCISSNSGGHQHHVIINWPGALVEGGVHDAGAGTFWTSWQDETGGDLTLRNVEIRVSGHYGLFHEYAGNRVTLDRVRVVGAQREAHSHGWVLAIRGDPGGGARNRMSGCEVFVPARRHSPAANYDYEVTLLHTASERNLFRTDLPAGGEVHYATEYGVGATALGDMYRGTAPGPHDSFRPGHNSTHDTREPYFTR